MKFDQQAFKSMSLNELYGVLQPSIDKIFKEYNYMEYSDTDFKELIETSLKLVQQKQIKINDNDIYIDLENYLRNIINKNVSKRILSKNGYKYVVNYINQNIHISSNYKETLGQFKKICDFFIEINCYPTLELLIDVLKSNTQINQILQTIVNKNIKQNQFEYVEFENENSILFIHAYCMLNGLTIVDENNELVDAEYNEDSNYNEDMVKKYLSNLSNKLLTVEEEKELAIRIGKGDKQARSLMVTYNLKLVVNIAKRYLNRGLDFLDLIQEGNMGLIKAVDRYDVFKGYKFSTYATWWIKQSIDRAIRNSGRNVRLPSHCYDKIAKYNKAITILKNELNREPSLDEIADYLCISIQELNQLYKLKQDTISINSKVTDKDDTEIGDFISDEKESPEEYFINKNIPNEINELLIKCNLPERMSDVLIYRYGLDGNEPKTLMETGKILGITRERVRQIELAALNRIRLSPYINDFAIYMQNPDKALNSIKTFREDYCGNVSEKNTRKIEEESNIMSKKLNTIYKLLEQYPKELVDIVINTLNDEEKELILLSYGEDLEHPVRSKKWNQKINNNFYGNLLPKMKKRLNEMIEGTKSKFKTIYELLNNCSKADVDAAIELLNNEDRVLLILANGEDLEHPVRDNRWNSQYEDKYFKELLPKLEHLVTTINSNNKLKVRTLNTNQDVIPISDSVSEFSKSRKEDLNKSKSTVSITEKENKEALTDNYLSILKMLRNPMFSEVMNELSAKEAVIVSLKLGYVDEKYFSNESIANFLQINPNEVAATVKRVLLIYKTYINKYIDEAIELMDSNKKIYKK